MTIGIDFDNTIVCYDELFGQLAREQDLVPDHIPSTKTAGKTLSVAARARSDPAAT